MIFKDDMDKLRDAHVLLVGVGGVGSYVVEALVRGGIGELTLCDFDTIDVSNLNRQLQTNHSNIGRSKVKEMAKRALLINPDLRVNIREMKVCSENINELFFACDDEVDLPVDSCEKKRIKYDYVCDAIDMVTSKLLLIKKCEELAIPIISSMGTGNKLDPTLFEITDIYKTSVCPLAKVMRKELKNLGIKKLKVLYSKEQALKCFVEGDGGRRSPASVSFVPSVAGLIIGGEIIKDIISE